MLGHKVLVLTNVPKSGQAFDRNVFRELKWSPEDVSNQTVPDNTELYSDVQLEVSGTFRYKFSMDGSSDSISGSGYFIVDPDLFFDDGTRLPMNAIQCQTILSKCLGSFDGWKLRLQATKDAGYNMVHFTPVQELGSSNSAYSISNQLKLNPSFGDVDFDQLKTFIQFLNKNWSILSITDVVLNHTANETPWLKTNPEVGYNMKNCPHLRPAFLFDRILHHLTLDIVNGRWESRGLSLVQTEHDLFLIRQILLNEYLPSIKIEQLFQVDVDSCLVEFENLHRNQKQLVQEPVKLEVNQDPEYRRLASKIDLNSVTFCTDSKLNSCDSNQKETSEETVPIPEQNRKKVIEGVKEQNRKKVREAIEGVNERVKGEIRAHLEAGVENVIRAIRYERLDDSGPKVTKLSISSPLVAPYFTFDIHDTDLKREEEVMYGDTGAQFMAHNGWVMDYDPLCNFAAPGSNVYLRRELIAWSDSVKLRFGSKPEDCPFLWNLMREYVEKTAQVFDGIRLDNCHSTPLQVAEYLIDAGRKVKPNLYVIAELFTSSEHLDNIFVNRLGINSLIRESMSCHDAHELGRLVHRFGGDPVGAFAQSSLRPLNPSMAHAVFFDVTHDNESMIEKRSAYDPLPSAAVIAMSVSATGSNRGFDQLVPHHIHVVNESRLYSTSTKNMGIISAKKLLNDLHSKLALQGYSELFVDQVDQNVLAITRHNPVTHKSVVLIARTSFWKESSLITGFIRSIPIAGRINQILLEGKMVGNADGFVRDPEVINGIPDFVSDVRTNFSVEKSAFISITKSAGINHLKFDKFTPSSVIAFDVQLDDDHQNAVDSLKAVSREEVKKIIQSFNLSDLNYSLFRIDREERDEFPDCGTYGIPGFTDFVYCGLAGMKKIFLDGKSSE